MRARDTDEASNEVYLASIRALGGDRRLEQGALLSDAMRAMTVQGIRERHPLFTERQVIHEFIRMIYGDKLAADVVNYGSQK